MISACETRCAGGKKRIGRCVVPGHGQGCEVTREIRESAQSRQAEAREVRVEGDFEYGSWGDEAQDAPEYFGKLDPGLGIEKELQVEIFLKGIVLSDCYGFNHNQNSSSVASATAQKVTMPARPVAKIDPGVLMDASVQAHQRKPPTIHAKDPMRNRVTKKITSRSIITIFLNYKIVSERGEFVILGNPDGIADACVPPRARVHDHAFCLTVIADRIPRGARSVTLTHEAPSAVSGFVFAYGDLLEWSNVISTNSAARTTTKRQSAITKITAIIVKSTTSGSINILLSLLRTLIM